MEHETKNEDHQTREDEFVNLWCTWMSEIHTKLEKMGSTYSSLECQNNLTKSIKTTKLITMPLEIN